jgi:LPXTG-motif cell wall-anchored protein
MRGRAFAAGVLLALTISGPTLGGSPTLDAWCINVDVPYSVPYPSGWYVHPPDQAPGIGSCEAFGPEPFTATSRQGPIPGALIEMGVVAACVGFVEEPISSTPTTVGGLDARRIELYELTGPRPPYLTMLWYVVPLDPGPCTSNDWRHFFAWTLESSGGNHVENKAVLDAMMAGLQFSATPNTAMEPPRGWSPLTVIGLAMLVAAGALLLRRRRALV